MIFTGRNSAKDFVLKVSILNLVSASIQVCMVMVCVLGCVSGLTVYYRQQGRIP